jgi:hypothetical protein
LADRKSVGARQIDIEYHCIRLARKDVIDGSAAMPLDFDAETVLLQKSSHDRGKLRIIFDQ